MEPNILEVEHLRTHFFTRRGEVRAVDDVSFSVAERQIVGIVGESGSGKSVTARSILGLVKQPGKVAGGSIRLDGRELTTLSQRQMNAVRGSGISMIFQEPMTSLNPVMKVGKQVRETVLLHRKTDRASAKREVLRLFEQVEISEPEKRYECYPHELSGGLRQRVMIAIAMVCRPRLLIADEPTTALDVTVEAQILNLMKKLRDETGTGMILISHNLGVIAEICDRVHVMYRGRIVEEANVFDLFARPMHPYTKGLLGAVTSLKNGGGRLSVIPGSVKEMLPGEEIGCGFAERCAFCKEICRTQVPVLADAGEGHRVRCFMAEGGK